MIPCGRSSASKYRSNRDIPVSTSIWVRFQPGRGGGRGGSRMNMTWNNGLRLESRSGCRLFTTSSIGTSPREQRRRALQLPPPVVQSARGRRFPQPSDLPEGEVPVLDARLPKGRGPAPDASLVERRELREEHGVHRHAVEDHLVQGDVEAVLFVAETDQAEPRQRSSNEVDRPPGIFGGQPQCLRFPFDLRQGA